MSFIGGEENQYLQVGFLVLSFFFFRFESYKLFGIVCLWIKLPGTHCVSLKLIGICFLTCNP